MSDYTPVNDFSAKDDLNPGDPEKKILGSDVDAETAAIQTAVNTKYDSSDLSDQATAEAGTDNTVLMTPLRTQQFLTAALSSQAQAEAGTDNTTVMTPLRVEQWSAVWGDENAGIVGDLHALTSPGADRILFWDNGGATAAFLTVGTGLSLTGTDLTTDDSSIDHDSLSNYNANRHIDHSALTLTAGAGLTGGGTIDSGVTFAVGEGKGINVTSTQVSIDINSLTATTSVDQTNDHVAIYDADLIDHRKVALEDLLTGGVYTAVKTANETVNSSTTLQNDDHLVISDVPTGYYKYEVLLDCTLTAVGDFKSTLTTTGALTSRGRVTTQENGALTAQSHRMVDFEEEQNFDLPSDEDYIIHYMGYIDMTTSGDIQFQWAQNTSDIDNTTVKAGSYMHLTRMGDT